MIIYFIAIVYSFDNFSILANENKKFLLEIKESLLIMKQTIAKSKHQFHTFVPIW